MDYIILHLTNMKLYVLVVVFYILGIIPWSIGLNGHLGLKLGFCLDIIFISLELLELWLGLSLWAMVVSTIVLTLFTFASLLGIILGSLLDNISLYGHLYGRLCFSTLGFGSYSLPFYVMVFYSIGLTLFWLCLTTLGLNLCLPSKDIGLLPSLINSLVIKLGLCLSGIILPSLCLGYLSIYVGYLRPYPILSDSVIVSSIYATLSTTLYPIEIDLLDIELSFIFPRGLGPFIAWPSISSLRILIIGYFLPSILLFMLLYLLLYLLYLLILIIIYLKKVKLH